MEKLRELVMMIIIMNWFCCCNCCLESERLALLQIKDNLFPNSPNNNYLNVPSAADCCSLDEVECNSATSHVIVLDLSFIRDWDSYYYLNASLFLPFQHLKELNLAGNGIAGCINNEGFEILSSTLTNLEILDLSYNKFNNTILQSLSALPTSLRSLNLAINRLNGTINNNTTGFERLSTLINLEILDLSDNNLNNMSILHSLNVLPSLKSLDLSINNLDGTIPSISGGGGEELFIKLNKLENLDLSYNQFKSLSSLNGISSLKTLDMSDNQFKGPFYFKELDGLRNLEVLYLSFNEITELILPKDFSGPSNLTTLYLDGMSIAAYENLLGILSRAFPSLKILSLVGLNINGNLSIGEGSISGSLEHLYMNSSTLENNFLKIIGNMRSLKTLSLARCGISGNIPAGFEGLCQLKHLQTLDLNDIGLNGNLPWCLANLTSLQYVDLSHNQFSGNIYLANFTSLQYLDLSSNEFNGNMSLSSFESLTSLQYLDLSYNFFQIPISLTPLFNLSQLKLLNVFDNTIYADHIEDHNLNPTFQLEDLCLNGHGDVGAIPNFLYHQRNLQSVVISSVKLRGMFPYWLLENNTRLQTLILSNNSLLGPLLLPNIPHVNLTFLDISDNYFNGYIPSQIGVYFPRLDSLDMSRNEFKGSIPDSLCTSDGLYRLDMSQNNISGRMPKCIGKLSQLQVLDLSNNNISGTLPSNFSSTSINVVKLSRNRLQGSLNNTFYYCSSQLIVLDLSHNNFSGSVPSWIERFSQLSYLVLGNNNFEGKIPNGLCKLKQLSFLDISHNRISGHIISCLNFTNYTPLVEQSLELTVKGHTYSYEAEILTYMSGIDTSSNILTGHIPPEIGNLGNIKTLNFSHNSLSGKIPLTFSNLKEIESLDLSSNNLQGTIPHQLTQLKSIEVFNVSYNNLSGPTPDNVAQFATFDESSYKGNPFLCGWPLLKSCSKQVDSPPSTTIGSAHNEESNNSFIDMEAFYASFGVSYGIVLMTIIGVLCINPYWRRVWFHYVQMSIDNSYYFMIDNVPFLSRFKFPHCLRRIYRYVRD